MEPGHIINVHDRASGQLRGEPPRNRRLPLPLRPARRRSSRAAKTLGKSSCRTSSAMPVISHPGAVLHLRQPDVGNHVCMGKDQGR
jgi:hypothetical protein